jgi:O-antigen/teichoic acid export membrane protein
VSATVARQRTITGRGATAVGLASVLSAASGYFILVIAARTLGPVRNADFLVFWSLLFGMFGIVSGLQQETTRSVRSAELSPLPAHHPVRVLPVGLLVGVGAAFVVGTTSLVWSVRTLGPGSWVLVVALCLAVPASSGSSAVFGALSGQRSWRAYSALVTSEAVVRLLLVTLVALAGAKGRGLEVASAAAAGTWIVFVLVSRPGRRAAHAIGDSDRGQFLRRVGQAMIAAASSAVLVVGFPVLLRLTSSNLEWVTAAPLLLAISLTRAPLLIPLTTYQGVAIAHFIGERDRGIAVLLRPAAAVLGVGALGSVGAYLVGSFIMTAFFGPEYPVDGLLLVGLTLAAVCLALLTLTGTAVLAHGRHRAYATGWFLSTAASVALLMTDLPLASRCVLSLCVGPLLGIGIHLWGIHSASRSPTSIGEDQSGGAPTS